MAGAMPDSSTELLIGSSVAPETWGVPTGGGDRSPGAGRAVDVLRQAPVARRLFRCLGGRRAHWLRVPLPFRRRLDSEDVSARLAAALLCRSLTAALHPQRHLRRLRLAKADEAIYTEEALLRCRLLRLDVGPGGKKTLGSSLVEANRESLLTLSFAPPEPCGELFEPSGPLSSLRSLTSSEEYLAPLLPHCPAGLRSLRVDPPSLHNLQSSLEALREALERMEELEDLEMGLYLFERVWPQIKAKTRSRLQSRLKRFRLRLPSPTDGNEPEIWMIERAHNYYLQFEHQTRAEATVGCPITSPNICLPLTYGLGQCFRHIRCLTLRIPGDLSPDGFSRLCSLDQLLCLSSLKICVESGLGKLDTAVELHLPQSLRSLSFRGPPLSEAEESDGRPERLFRLAQRLPQLERLQFVHLAPTFLEGVGEMRADGRELLLPTLHLLSWSWALGQPEYDQQRDLPRPLRFCDRFAQLRTPPYQLRLGGTFLAPQALPACREHWRRLQEQLITSQVAFELEAVRTDGVHERIQAGGQIPEDYQIPRRVDFRPPLALD